MPTTFSTAAAEARAAFGNDTLYMERYIGNARHIEVRSLGDRSGNVIHLGERDCSLQRRHQKIIEEAPAYAVSTKVRDQICHAATVLARSIGYQNAGTVEFIFDNDSNEFFFLEMNTRIQVEHPVTEMITGVDLVAQQLRIARGEPLPFTQADVRFSVTPSNAASTPSRRSMNFVLAPDASPSGRDRRAPAFGWIPTAIPVTSCRPSTIHFWQS